MDQAMSLLNSASQDPSFGPVQRERFGFELATLIAREKGAQEACAAWRRHLQRFPGSPHKEHVVTMLRKCR